MTTQERKRIPRGRWRAWVCGLMCAGLLAGTVPARAAETTRKVTVEVERIAATQTLEVGLNVTAADFKSVGAILRFDTGKLTLAQWDAAATPVKPVDGTAWDHYSIVPSKGVDDAGAKPAVAYTDKDDPKHAFVYFGADAFGVLPQVSDRRLVTLRFDFVGTPEEKKALYEGLSQETLNSYLEIAQDDAAIYSMAGAAVQSISEDAQGNQTAYRFHPVKLDETTGLPVPDAGEDGLDLTLDAQVILDLDGESEMGTAVTAEACAITFLDWDGTILATAAVARKEDISAEVKALEGKPGLKEALEGKPGYTFDCWLDHNAAIKPFTSNAESVKDQPGVVDFTKITDSIQAPYYGITVQAAYAANQEINSGTGLDTPTTADAARYTIEGVSFYQLGISTDDTTGQYAVRGTVKRGSAVRTETPVVLLQVYIGQGNEMKYLTARCELRNGDEAAFEAAVPKTTTRVTYTVLDAGQLANWAGGTPRSLEGATDGKTLVKEGAFALLAEEAHKGWNLANAQCFQDAGYPKVTDENIAAARTALAAVSVNAVPTRATADDALSSFQ